MISWMCIVYGIYVCSSSSVDTPVETIVPSVILDEEVQEKEEEEEAVADVNEVMVQESPSPAITRPPHTSPDLSFATEVMSKVLIYSKICKREGIASSH